MILNGLIKKSLMFGIYPVHHIFGTSRGYGVLLYHRIVEDALWDSELDPSICIRSGDFEKQMEYIRDYCTPIPLSEMVYRMRNKIRPDKLYVSVSFDDGYSDNYTLGLPALEKYNIKATVFISAGYVENNDMMPYWDEVTHFAKQSDDPLSLPDINGHECYFNLNSLKGKRKFLSAVTRWNYQCPQSTDEILRLIRKRNTGGYKKTNSFFTWDMLKEAMASGHYEAGCHTMTHPVLGFIDDHGKREIEESKSVLENHLQIPVHLFSYPLGGANVITPEVCSVVRKAGFIAAFTNNAGINSEQEDLFLIKRIPVPGGENLRDLRCRIHGANFLEWMHSLKNGFNV